MLQNVRVSVLETFWYTISLYMLERFTGNMILSEMFNSIDDCNPVIL